MESDSSTNNPFVNKVLLRQSIGSVRIVIALFTVGAAVTKILYDYFLPNLTDFNIVRWSIIALGVVFFGTTFIPVRRALVVTYFSFFLYLSTLLYVIAYVAVNRFDPNAVTILILVIGASTVIMNSLSYYGIQSSIILFASLLAYAGGYLDRSQAIAFLNLLLGLSVFAIVIVVRLKLIDRVKQSHANLEKLNVLSIVANPKGEIVFISPSVQGLLGYEAKELLRNGWWGTGNLREGWISREYILNYPMMPKELTSLETKVTHKDGRTVWLNWANSMLPNGNYMGLALDITRYKKADLRINT